MKNQKKKLRLEDIKVESFVTAEINQSDTVRGGTWFGDCHDTGGCSNGKLCSNLTFCPVENCRFPNSVFVCQEQ